jgi:hypothetical protein
MCANIGPTPTTSATATHNFNTSKSWREKANSVIHPCVSGAVGSWRVAAAAVTTATKMANGMERGVLGAAEVLDTG